MAYLILLYLAGILRKYFKNSADVAAIRAAADESVAKAELAFTSDADYLEEKTPKGRRP